MKPEGKKTASLAMLAPTEAQAQRLERELPVILAMTEELADAPAEPERMENALPLSALRRDEAMAPDERRENIRLSQNEKEGFVRVARTVG